MEKPVQTHTRNRVWHVNQNFRLLLFYFEHLVLGENALCRKRVEQSSVADARLRRKRRGKRAQYRQKRHKYPHKKFHGQSLELYFSESKVNNIPNYPNKKS